MSEVEPSGNERLAPTPRRRALASLATGALLWCLAVAVPWAWVGGEDGAVSTVAAIAPLIVLALGAWRGHAALLLFGFPSALGLVWAAEPGWGEVVGSAPAAWLGLAAAGAAYFWSCAEVAGARERGRGGPSPLELAHGLLSVTLLGVAVLEPVLSGGWRSAAELALGDGAEWARAGAPLLGVSIWGYVLLGMQGPVLRLARLPASTPMPAPPRWTGLVVWVAAAALAGTALFWLDLERG